MKSRLNVNLITKYQTYLIVFSILIILLILRSVILRQPEERLTYTIHKGELLESVKISGTYGASSQTQVFSPANGVISQLYVTNQANVQKGDPLFHIESTATDEEKATANTNYQQAVTALQNAKQAKETTDATMWVKQKALLDSENNLNLMNDRLAESIDNPATNEPYTQLEIESIKSAVTTTRKEFANLESQYKHADQTIGSAQALVNSAKLALDATESKTVYSPANGKVVNLLKNVGDGVINRAGGQPILLVTNLKSPTIFAKTSEIDVIRLKEGQVAQIVFDADKKSVFTGEVTAIDTIGTTTAGVTTYDVRIKLSNFSSSAIRPGMTATITINTYKNTDVVSVPNSAILYQDNQAFLKKANTQEDLVKISLGYQGISKTEIASDLPDGLEILAVIDQSKHK
ncbi:MAG TPA: efflux RND transporter periplasmic adaptor subunit [Candidatus Woesebacteria bacterium]|nr:efflux RND transporter periplasmic adaptor subunit [Candidatus Woesebacteria bacterium]HNS95110.1 efflux RND transporter periplasmic adaptor subunit [Candidatus Woesebacteria bacterium]